MFYDLPSDPAKAKQLMQRFFRENLAVETNIQATRRRPPPPRGLAGRKDLLEPHILLTWVGPQNMSAVLGFNVYEGNENNRVQNINNPSTLQATIPLFNAVLPIGFYVSCYSALLESIKVPIIVSS